MIRNVDEMKSEGFRLAKRINHALQRSKMNSQLKPFFTESSIKYVEKDGKKGIVLNEKMINNEIALKALSSERYTNNLKLINETVKNILDKEILGEEYVLTECSDSDEEFLFETKNGAVTRKRYTQCMLMFNESAVVSNSSNENSTENNVNYTIDDDEDETIMLKKKIIDAYPDTYYKEPESEGGATYRELMGEIMTNSINRVLADPVEGKTKVSNASHSIDLDSEVAAGAGGYREDVEINKKKLDFDKVLALFDE